MMINMKIIMTKMMIWKLVCKNLFNLVENGYNSIKKLKWQQGKKYDILLTFENKSASIHNQEEQPIITNRIVPLPSVKAVVEQFFLYY